MKRGLLRRLERLEKRLGHDQPQMGFELFDLSPDGALIRCGDFEYRPGNPTLRLVFVEAAEGQPIGWAKYKEIARPQEGPPPPRGRP